MDIGTAPVPEIVYVFLGMFVGWYLSDRDYI